MKVKFTDYIKHLVGKKSITEPIFLKDFESENEQIRDIRELVKEASSDKKAMIEKDMLLLKYGLEGEANVYYELKNSFVPMLCLHDIRLPYGDYYAQFDFIVITNKFIYVLETKKLSGDIEINADGDFIRIIKNRQGKIVKKEGMYSPISQSDRQVNILRSILLKEGIIKTFPIKSAVVIANPRTIINKKKCPKLIQEKIYKHDQIINLLQTEMKRDKDRNMLEKVMFEVAHYLIEKNEPLKMDYAAKYSIQDVISKKEDDVHDSNNITVSADIESNIYLALKDYRLNIARQEQIKAYWVFTNKELDEIVEQRPKTIPDLLEIKGFGEKKVEKYGGAIVAIVNAG